MEAAFAQVQSQLDRVAGRHARERGGDMNETRSIVYEAFVDAEASWEIDHGNPHWPTYLCNRAWWRLIDHGRREQTQLNRLTDADLDQRQAAGPGRIEALLAELGDDARIVCRLVLESPGELAEAFANGEPWACRKSLRKWLSGLGWTAERIIGTFQEIREALQ